MDMKKIRNEIEERAGRARIWIGQARVEVTDPGITPRWALQGASISVDVDVDVDDDREDWWGRVESRIQREMTNPGLVKVD